MIFHMMARGSYHRLPGGGGGGGGGGLSLHEHNILKLQISIVNWMWLRSLRQYS